jgi:tetratricopeptide (TPR) repeat protein
MIKGTVRVLLAVGACLAIGAAWYFQRSAQHTLHQQLLVDARTALEQGQHQEAESLARRVIASGYLTAESRLVAGEAAVGLGASDRALAYLAPLMEGRDSNAVMALGAAANIHWERGELTQAETQLRRLLEISPDQPYATSRLAYLLTLTGRHWESLPLRLSLMKLDSFEFDDLLLWGNARSLVHTEELTRLRRLSPEDPLLALGAACVSARSNDVSGARKLLEPVLTSRPDLVEARVLEGYLLLDRGNLAAAEIQAWNGRLPPGADEHPDIWVIRGLWTARAAPMAERRGSDDGVAAGSAAGRCFWEAVRRSPNHQTASYQLALVLRELDNSDADWFRERSEMLEELQRMLGVLDTQRSDLATMQRVVELNEKLGRPWEVWGWSRVALLVDPSLKWAERARDRAAAQIKSSPPQVLAEFDPGVRHNYSAWPLPGWISDAR